MINVFEIMIDDIQKKSIIFAADFVVHLTL